MYKEKSRVRKSEQKRYEKENRLLLKNSKRILTKRAFKLKDEQKQRVNAILYISDALREAYILLMAIAILNDSENAYYIFSDTKAKKQN